MWPVLRPGGGTWTVLLPYADYVSDLSFPDAASVRRQLALDVPRSCVLVDGVRARDARRVYAHRELCTQAVLAPALEWLRASGLMAVEARHAMSAHVRGPVVSVHKRLALCDGTTLAPMGEVTVRVKADGHLVMLSCTLSTEEKWYVVGATEALGEHCS